MSEVYDAIAKEYQDSKMLPFRRFSEEPTLLQLLDGIKGFSVLDIACGEGIYSRRMKKLGARHVVGIDISPEMIALARKMEANEPLDITYEVHDASISRTFGDFDIVVASYLFNYAQSKAQLVAFCANIFKNLRPGGRVVGMNDNPANDPQHYALYRPYGFTKSAPLPRKEGDPVTYTFYNADGTDFSFDNFFLNPDTYASVFREAGFKSFRWVPPIVTKEGMERHGAAYWQLYLQDPPVIGFEAVK